MSYRYGKEIGVVRSPINSHQYTFTNNTVSNIEPLVSNSTFNDLSCGSGESLVDTTFSISKMLLLCFIILDLIGDHTTHSIHHTKILKLNIKLFL